MKRGFKSWQVLCWDSSMAACRQCDGDGGLLYPGDQQKHACPHCDGHGNTKSGVANALRFASLDEAQAYGRDLSGRWMALRKWEATESTDVPNYAWAFLGGGYGELLPMTTTKRFKNYQTFERYLFRRPRVTTLGERLRGFAPHTGCKRFAVRTREELVICEVRDGGAGSVEKCA